MNAQSIQKARADLALALRAAAHHGLSEGVCNHFSVDVGGDRFLINPQGLHWSEISPDDVVLCDGQGRVIEGKHSVEPTAFFIHSWVHRLAPAARVVLHTHMPFATALTLTQGGRLEWASQGALRFHGKVAYDADYNGLVLDDAEGQRIGGLFKAAGSQASVLFLANHGVIVTGDTVAWAYDDLYYLERAAMHQVLAQSTGKPLKLIDPAIARKTAAQIAGERQQSDLFFETLRRMLPPKR